MTAFIFALFDTVNRNLPRTKPDEFDELSGVDPPWLWPVRYMTGSARIMEQDIPLLTHTGLSSSLLACGRVAVKLLRAAEVLEISENDGLDIAGSTRTEPAAALLAKIVVGSADAEYNDVLSDVGVCGPAD